MLCNSVKDVEAKRMFFCSTVVPEECIFGDTDPRVIDLHEQPNTFLLLLILSNVVCLYTSALSAFRNL